MNGLDGIQAQTMLLAPGEEIADGPGVGRSGLAVRSPCRIRPPLVASVLETVLTTIASLHWHSSGLMSDNPLYRIPESDKHRTAIVREASLSIDTSAIARKSIRLLGYRVV